MNSTKPRGTARIADRPRGNYYKSEASILGIARREWRGLRAGSALPILPLLLLLILPTLAQAQFNYTVENGTVTITGYTGPGGDMVIPGTIEGLPVARIARRAFYECIGVISVVIPIGITTLSSPRMPLRELTM